MDKRQKNLLIQTLFYAWENLSDHSEANRRWKAKWQTFHGPAFLEELLGIDREPIGICKYGTLNPKILEIGLSSGQCSTTLKRQEKEMKRIVFQIQTKSTFTRRDSRRDIGPSLGPGDEKK